MAEIKITPELLRSTAGELQNIGTQLDNSTRQMLDTVSQLDGEIFSGEAVTQFKARFNQLQGDMARMNKMVGEHVSDLQAMAANMEAATQKAAGIAGELKGDIIV